jgi:FkbM family methyltransferase
MMTTQLIAIWILLCSTILLVTTNAILFGLRININNGTIQFLYTDSVDAVHVAEAIIHLMNGGFDPNGECVEHEKSAKLKCQYQVLAKYIQVVQRVIDDTPLKPIKSSHFLEGVETVLLNLGCNLDPIVPELFRRVSDQEFAWWGQSIKTLAFEPVPSVFAQIHRKPWLHVVNAAVGHVSGVQQMYLYNEDGVASSLYEKTRSNTTNVLIDYVSDDGPESVLAPVLSLQSVLDAIPPSIDIPFLKSDIQGADFEVIASVGSDLLRVRWLLTEVWHSNLQLYKGVRNDFCGQWLPHMTRLGYSVRGLRAHSLFYPESADCLDLMEHSHDLAAHCARRRVLHPDPRPGSEECDILWARDDVDWRDEQQWPPVAGELQTIHWTATGTPLFNSTIKNKFGFQFVN